ncbi:MAG: MltA domain-containing protein, partial [Brucella intermedia]
IAFVADRVDVFFAHVQGAARLKLRDGQVLRITYAAKTGHPFTGIGRILVADGEIPASEISMQAIRRWLAEHPDRADDLIWRNRSYIFFREAPVDDPDAGPVAAAKVPLTAGRSLAVDRLLHTFGTPIHVSAPTVTVFDGEPFARLMIAQDTGTAIVGPARGDLFAGSGEAAGEIAGGVKNDAEFYALVPRTLLGA